MCSQADQEKGAHPARAAHHPNGRGPMFFMPQTLNFLFFSLGSLAIHFKQNCNTCMPQIR